jgi:periplasmic protein TonB
MREEFLDTDRLLKLHYGNLVLRRQAHLFLGCGVIAAIALLLFFGLLTINWESIASGRELSGKATPGDAYAEVTTMIELAPPPSSPKSAAAPVHSYHATSPAVGKIVKVSREEAPLEHTAATQSELKEANQKQGNQGAQGSASGKGGETSGLEGLDEDGAVSGFCEKMPSFLEQKKPLYPEAARIAGITGKVVVKVLIGEEGRPLKAIILKRIPEECTLFDRVALKSVLESTYSPGVQNGRAVKVWCVIPISFRLI